MRNYAAEILGDGLAHVGEGGADAEIDAGGQTRRVSQDRDIFARVIGGGIDGVGIAAVVGGDDKQIGFLQSGEERAEERVEFFEGAREAFDVFAMAVKHVEIDEIREDEAAWPPRQ